MIHKSRNRTRYHTDDLNVFIHTLLEKVGRPGPRIESVDPHYGTFSLTWLGHTRMLVATPARLVREIPLQSIGFLTDDFMPPCVLRSIGELILCHTEAPRRKWGHGGREPQEVWDSRFEAYQANCRAALEHALSTCKVRVMPRIEAGPRPHRTREERVERLQTDSFYGPGGVLEGPQWAYASGHRSPTWRWHEAVRRAEYYYSRELDHRMSYARRIENLGGEVVPYESFADWLRSYADRLDGGKKNG